MIRLDKNSLSHTSVITSAVSLQGSSRTKSLQGSCLSMDPPRTMISLPLKIAECWIRDWWSLPIRVKLGISTSEYNFKLSCLKLQNNVYGHRNPFPHISSLSSTIESLISVPMLVPPMIMYEFGVDTDAYQNKPLKNIEFTVYVYNLCCMLTPTYYNFDHHMEIPL